MTLPNTVCSPQDVLEVTDELALILRRLKPSAHHTQLKKIVDDDISQSTKLLLDFIPKGNLNATSVKTLITFLEDIYRTSPQVVVTVAAPPSEDVKQRLTEWFRKNISPLILVQVQYNRAILGGLVVRMGSHIYDWSFRSKLTDNSFHFSEVLTRV